MTEISQLDQKTQQKKNRLPIILATLSVVVFVVVIIFNFQSTNAQIVRELENELHFDWYSRTSWSELDDEGYDEIIRHAKCDSFLDSAEQKECAESNIIMQNDFGLQTHRGDARILQELVTTYGMDISEVVAYDWDYERGSRLGSRHYVYIGNTLQSNGQFGFERAYLQSSADNNHAFLGKGARTNNLWEPMYRIWCEDSVEGYTKLLFANEINILDVRCASERKADLLRQYAHSIFDSNTPRPISEFAKSLYDAPLTEAEDPYLQTKIRFAHALAVHDPIIFDMTNEEKHAEIQAWFDSDNWEYGNCGAPAQASVTRARTRVNCECTLDVYDIEYGFAVPYERTIANWSSFELYDCGQEPYKWYE